MLADQEYAHVDEFTRLASLSETLDFAQAQKDLTSLQNCKDYFLIGIKDSIVESVREHIVALYCKIYASVCSIVKVRLITVLLRLF